ncbi:MAG: tetratricopeptide repeat protein [Candidatus Heimdallarchaeota archaeon]
MADQTRVPKKDEKLAKEIMKKIVISGKLGETSTLEEVAVVLGDYVEDELTGYRADIFDPEIGENCISVRKKLEKKDDLDDLSDFFDMLKGDPLTEDEQGITTTIRLAYSLLLKKYKILDPLAYEKILEKMGLQQLKIIPKYSQATYESWSSKIIEQFIITNSASLEKVTNSVIQFFQMLFPDYSVKYYNWKDKKKYPLLIDKKGDDSLMWVMEIGQLRTILFNTHYVLLNKLRRKKDYPSDPDFWFDLVILYDEIAQKEKAKEFGAYGLKLNPQEVGALSSVISHYVEKRQLKESLPYLKQTAHIYTAKKMLSIAETTWKHVLTVEPFIKENWKHLEEILTALGKTDEARQCFERRKKMK